MKLRSWTNRNRKIFRRRHVFKGSCWTDPRPLETKSLSGWVLGFCWSFEFDLLSFLKVERFFFFKKLLIKKTSNPFRNLWSPEKNLAPKHTQPPTSPYTGFVCLGSFPKQPSLSSPIKSTGSGLGIFLPGWLCGVGSGQSSRGRTFGRSWCWSFGWGVDPHIFFVLPRIFLEREFF